MGVAGGLKGAIQRKLVSKEIQLLGLLLPSYQVTEVIGIRGRAILEAQPPTRLARAPI